MLRGNFTTFMCKTFQIWDHFFPFLFPKDSEILKSLDIGLWEGRAKRRFNKVNQWKKNQWIFFLPRRLYNLYLKKFVFLNLRPLFSITFPQWFWKSKNLDIGLQEVGAKRRLKEVRKCDKHTNKNTKNTCGHYDL